MRLKAAILFPIAMMIGSVIAGCGRISNQVNYKEYTLGGTATGLTGTLVLQNNGGNDLTLTASGPFTFIIPVADGTDYAVTVKTAPASQTCAVASGSGKVSGANITDVTVVCSASNNANAANPYTLSGAVTGLHGTLVLQNNGGDDLTVTTDGRFTFATGLADRAAYAVTIKSSPANMRCSVSDGAGTVAGANITGVAVSCVSTMSYTIGGTVTGLTGILVLENNGGDDLTVTADGAFAFFIPVADGASYAATIKTDSANEICTVAHGSGTVSGSNITDISVVCSPYAYTVGGQVTGLVGELILKNNSGDALTLRANGGFTFATAIADGASYGVTVGTQPAAVTCLVTNAAGNIAGANVTNVAVTCVPNTYTIGGTLSGLVGTIVLRNNGGESLTLTGNGSFTFPTSELMGASYNVTVLTSPALQTCLVKSGTGTVASTNITNVTVTCGSAQTISGSTTGLSGTLVLQNNGSDDLTLTASGPFTFATPVSFGAGYAVTVKTQPIGQICTVTGASGAVAAASITNVAVVCKLTTQTVGGAVFGLIGTIVLQDNGGDDLTLTSDGSFTFGTAVSYGASYAVTVKTQPTGQICTVSSGTGTMGTTHVTNVTVSCALVTEILGGVVTGLNGKLILQNNGGDDLTLTANGTFTFGAAVTYGTNYAVTIKSQPAWQSCTILNSTGTMRESSVTNVAVTCTNSCPVSTVTSNADSGAGTLRGAINNVESGCYVLFDKSLAGSTITLTTGALAIFNKSLTIDGTTLSAPITISGNSNSRVFSITNSATVALNGLAITGGVAPDRDWASGGGGGGIYCNYGSTLTISNSTIYHNSANLSDNAIWQYGGGIAVKECTFTLRNSTVFGNTARDAGGGLALQADSDRQMTLTNVTISGNSVTNPTDGGGGGIMVNYKGNVSLAYVTVTGNFVAAWGMGGGILGNGNFSLASSIIAGNTAGGVAEDLAGTFVSQDYNLIMAIGSATMTGPTTHNIMGSDPLLSGGGLANNGGPTQTISIGAGSPAKDAIPNGSNGCGTTYTTDQRGSARPHDNACDIGAFEL